MENKEVRLIDANACPCNECRRQWCELPHLCTNFGLWLRRTIDPESLRPHGKWRLNDDGSGTCLNCYRTAAACWDYDNALSYCPHCGAKMDDIEGDDFDDDFDPGEDWEASRCYECGAYGDDYYTDENGEMACNCDRCPYNSMNKED